MQYNQTSYMFLKEKKSYMMFMAIKCLKIDLIVPVKMSFKYARAINSLPVWIGKKMRPKHRGYKQSYRIHVPKM